MTESINTPITPALAMALPASGLVGDACARQLNGVVDDMDDHLAVHDDAAGLRSAKH